jgi:hypothetical protein
MTGAASLISQHCDLMHQLRPTARNRVATSQVFSVVSQSTTAFQPAPQLLP